MIRWAVFNLLDKQYISSIIEQISALNPFYRLNLKLQWTISIIMLILLLLVFVYWLKLITISFAYYALLFLFTPILQFLLTPFFTLIGVYQYLSPMLLVYMANDKSYDLHNGTSFDYLFVMTKKNSSITFKNRMLLYYIEGLLAIIEKIEIEKLPTTVLVRGSSYFFSDRTAKRLGFSIASPKSTEKVNIYINYLDLTWMYSIANGKLTLPKVQTIKTAEIKGADLLLQKSELLRLKTFINRNNYG